jgi:hypothetical protein
MSAEDAWNNPGWATAAREYREDKDATIQHLRPLEKAKDTSSVVSDASVARIYTCICTCVAKNQ